MLICIIFFHKNKKIKNPASKPDFFMLKTIAYTSVDIAAKITP